MWVIEDPAVIYVGECFAYVLEEGFLISPCYSLELCIQMSIFPFLLCL